jgi:dihydrofolate reductase
MGVTVDGYVAAAKGDPGWGLGPEHPAVHEWKVASLRRVGTHIMGRVTYGEMASHWPRSTDEYARFMNELPKVVFSSSLSRADWPGTRIAAGDMATELAALKAESGDEIMAHGGAAFVQALSRLGLIDEYRMVIVPVVAGRGLPLFKDLSRPMHVTLVQATVYPDGTAIHVYRPAASGG